MKAIWSGTLGFGLVTIPVSLHSAVEASERVSFRQLHKKDKSPIRYKKFCSKEDKEVPASEIVRGFEVSKGRFEALRTVDELRSPSEIKISRTQARPSEVKLAKSLIDQMSEENWDPTAHPDDYEKALRKLLASKPTFRVEDAAAEAAGGEDNVVDLMEALRKSVAKTRESRPRGAARRRGAA